MGQRAILLLCTVGMRLKSVLDGQAFGTAVRQELHVYVNTAQNVNPGVGRVILCQERKLELFLGGKPPGQLYVKNATTLTLLAMLTLLKWPRTKIQEKKLEKVLFGKPSGQLCTSRTPQY